MLHIDFAPGTTLLRETDRPSELPILRNGPPGTFVVFADGLRVSLPTDQIVWADDSGGRAEVRFGGMQFVGIEDGSLVFLRVREMHPEEQLSPARSHKMVLSQDWVTSVVADGRVVWPGPSL